MNNPLPPLTDTWRKSSYSQPSDSYCVEAGTFTAGTVSVRDSKDPEGPTLTFPAASWTTFVAFVISDRT